MSLPRRSFLQQSAAFGTIAPLLTPFLDQLTASHRDDHPLPRRFVFVVKASGVDNFNLMPSTIAERPDAVLYHEDSYKFLTPPVHTDLVNESLQDLSLPDVLSPLGEFRERINIIQGLSGNHLKGNHTAGYGTLSCHSSELAPIAPTVDALLGLQHSSGPYPMYGMATNGTLRGQAVAPDDTYVYPNLSAYKSGQGVAFQASPTKAFHELFGARVLSDSDRQKKNAVQRNLMDFLKDDAQRIRRQLSTSNDRERFDGYIDTFDSLRLREQRKADLKDRIDEFAPEYAADKYEATNHMDRMECHFDLATAAIITGLTNVVTLRPDTLGAQYQQLGTGSLGLHQIGHGASTETESSPQLRRKIVRYHMRLIAQMAQRLASIPEGNGSMLDQTMIVYLSCAGGQHHAGLTDWPVVTIGGSSQRLRSGRYLQYPSYRKDGHRTLANFYMSLLDSADVPYGEQFGQPDPALRDFDTQGPLEELSIG